MFPCRFGQNQWEAIANDERLGLRDKLAAAAAEKTLKKAGKKAISQESQLPRGTAFVFHALQDNARSQLSLSSGLPPLTPLTRASS